MNNASSRTRFGRGALLRRWLLLLLLSAFGLQLYFVARVAMMRFVDPYSTAFERSQILQILKSDARFRWRQQWVPSARIHVSLSRAVIASEDDVFASHDGVQWQAIEKAWTRNEKAQARSNQKGKTPKVVGGSTITQQLAKNLFLSGERNFLRKGQELVITLALEAFLSKQRILEIYLNHVEWGKGVFGAQAAAQHYFSKPASRLQSWESARLAVMLPRPKYFEKLPQSPYLAERAQVIQGRMASAVLP
jgi:monofunctional biosynthetic peptidoglycan transglycosylase